MREAVVVSTARTGLTKSFRGEFNNTHGAAMAGHAIRHAIERAGVEPGEVEDVFVGCANPEGATGTNIGRNAALWAGCPVTTAGAMNARFTRSSLSLISETASSCRNRAGSSDRRALRRLRFRAVRSVSRGGLRMVRNIVASVDFVRGSNPDARSMPALFWYGNMVAASIDDRHAGFPSCVANGY